MRIEIKLDDAYEEPTLVIMTNKVTDEIKLLMDKLKDEPAQLLAGFNDDACVVLNPNDIVRVFAQSGKVIAETQHGFYNLHLRLYEVEERLKTKSFVCISNSDIINLAKVTSFDLSFAGTIHVKLTNGTETYVSRRFVGKIKQLLGLKGNGK